jgi:hypothetical protein
MLHVKDAAKAWGIHAHRLNFFALVGLIPAHLWEWRPDNNSRKTGRARWFHLETPQHITKRSVGRPRKHQKK